MWDAFEDWKELKAGSPGEPVLHHFIKAYAVLIAAEEEKGIRTGRGRSGGEGE